MNFFLKILLPTLILLLLLIFKRYIDDISILVNIVCWYHLLEIFILVVATLIVIGVSHIVGQDVIEFFLYVFALAVQKELNYEAIARQIKIARLSLSDQHKYLRLLFQLLLLHITNKDQKVSPRNPYASRIGKSSENGDPLFVWFLNEYGEAILSDLEYAVGKGNFELLDWDDYWNVL